MSSSVPDMKKQDPNISDGDNLAGAVPQGNSNGRAASAEQQASFYGDAEPGQEMSMMGGGLINQQTLLIAGLVAVVYFLRQ